MILPVKAIFALENPFHKNASSISFDGTKFEGVYATSFIVIGTYQLGKYCHLYGNVVSKEM